MKGAERTFWGNSGFLNLHVFAFVRSHQIIHSSLLHFKKRILTKFFFQIKDVCCDSLVSVIFFKLFCFKYFILYWGIAD